MNDFIFGGASLECTVNRLRALADDLESLAVFKPREELEDAPRLEHWRFAMRPVGCLSGHVAAHPMLGDQHVFTSEIYAIDPKRRWARTYSRFYVLGQQARDQVGGA